MSLIYTLGIFTVYNLYTFFLMAWDKRAAKKNQWRISEKRFFLLALLGGSIGVWIAMDIWKHKRQKNSFKYPIYAILSLHLVIALGLAYTQL